MASPDIVTHYTHGTQRINVEWYSSALVPQFPIAQVYAVALLENTSSCLVVNYDNGDKDNLPGGKLEPGESIQDALYRELSEETNCEVLWWRYLGHQRLTSKEGLDTMQARVAAEVRPLGEFVCDPGGSVSGYDLVPLEQLNERIRYGKVGDYLTEQTTQLLKDDDSRMRKHAA